MVTIQPQLDKVQRLFEETRCLVPLRSSQSDQVQLPKTVIQAVLSILDENTLRDLQFARHYYSYQVQPSAANISHLLTELVTHRQISQIYMREIQVSDDLLKTFRKLIIQQQANLDFFNQRQRNKMFKDNKIAKKKHLFLSSALKQADRDQTHQLQIDLQNTTQENTELMTVIRDQEQQIVGLQQKQAELQRQKTQQNNQNMATINSLQDKIQNYIQQSFFKDFEFDSECQRLQGRVNQLEELAEANQATINSLRNQLALRAQELADEIKQNENKTWQILKNIEYINQLDKEKYYKQQREQKATQVQRGEIPEQNQYP